jgi:hypothetical protein
MYKQAMIKPCADNPKIEQALGKICQTIVDNGGYIDPNISVSYQNDVFSVCKTGEITVPHAIKVPHSLLIPYQAFDLDIEDGRIVVASYKDHVTALQLQMFKDVLALYNETPLLKNHYESNPWLHYQRHPQIIALLLRGRTGDALAVIRKMLTDPDYKDELALFTFFKKRLAFARTDARSSDVTEVIMPVIEFLTHHPQGGQYQNVYEGASNVGFMCIDAQAPVENSVTCHASYGAIDALEGYLNYGFISEYASFVRSCPLQIEIDGLGTLAINANNIIEPIDGRPEHLKNLGYYLPRIHYFDDLKLVRLSHLIVPGVNAPHSLKRVLREAVLAFDETLNDAEIAAYVKDIEQQLIEKNLDFYSELTSLIDFSSASSILARDLERVISHQQKIIGFYQQRIM